MSAPAVERDALDTVVGFGRTLRAAGVAADPARVHTFVQALAALDPARRADVYWAGRATLCSDAEDLARYDRAFSAYFAGEVPPVRRRPVQISAQRVPEVPVGLDDPGAAGEDGEVEERPALSSGVEVLRHRDVATLGPADRVVLARLLAAFALPGEPRRTRRWAAAHRGPVDVRRAVRSTLRAGGDPPRLPRRRHRTKPRRVVLLVDVSGSMSPYADALLRFAHAASRGRAGAPRTEVFTVGTRLTRVTRELSSRDPDTAMAALAAAVPDWSGGTRLGELLKAFVDRWGQRGLARGAVVVVLSDGWERGDAALLGEQTARLSRLAHRLVWANPLKARPGYAPLAAGMAAALPHVDDFVEGHSLAALEHLAGVVQGARGPGAQGARGWGAQDARQQPGGPTRA